MSQEGTRNTTTRRALLAGAPAVAVTMASGTAIAVVTPDPIFAAIASHRAAIAHYIEQLYELDDQTPRAVLDRCADRLWDVLTTQPTTMAGCIAVLEHVGQPQWLDIDEKDEIADDETVLSVWSHDGDESDMKRAAMEFPLLIAVAMRNIIERGRA